jgi:hypothetical protein
MIPKENNNVLRKTLNFLAKKDKYLCPLKLFGDYIGLIDR